MKNWWIRIGCFLTGYNYKIIENSSEASAKSVKKYLSAIIIVSLLWGFIGYAFTNRYLHADKTVSLAGALIMVIVVIQIERQIILSIGKIRLAAIFRAMIGIVMALIGSLIIDQVLFKDDIEKENVSHITDDVNKQLPKRTSEIDLQIAEIASNIDAKETERTKVIAEVSAKPTITLPAMQTSYTRDSSGKMKVANRTISNQSAPNPKADLIPKIDEQIKSLNDRKDEKERNKLNIRSDLEKELKSKTGFLDELNVLYSILTTRNSALIVWLLFFFFFLSIELFVLVSKIGDHENDYDRIVLHQLAVRIQMLEKLTQDMTKENSVL
jgi:hypothetical protein